MQISDMLGQYNRNVANGTEELHGSQGVQKLVSTVGELSAGSIFEGTVNQVKNGKVSLALANGQVITARLDGKVDIRPGSSMFFQVRSNDGATVSIRPYNGTGNAGNPILLNALTAAGVPVTERSLSMVDAMMKEQMSIGRQSILDMVKILNNHPGANVETVVSMTKLGIPVTETMAAQFENYMADRHAILNEMELAVDQMTAALGDESLSAGDSFALYGKLLNVFLGGGQADGTGMADGTQPAGGNPAGTPTEVPTEAVQGNLAQSGGTAEGQANTEIPSQNQTSQNVTLQNISSQDVTSQNVTSHPVTMQNTSGETVTVAGEMVAASGENGNAGEPATVQNTGETPQPVAGTVTAENTKDPEALSYAEQKHAGWMPQAQTDGAAGGTAIGQLLSEGQLANLEKQLSGIPGLAGNPAFFFGGGEETLFVNTMTDEQTAQAEAMQQAQTSGSQNAQAEAGGQAQTLGSQNAQAEAGGQAESVRQTQTAAPQLAAMTSGEFLQAVQKALEENRQYGFSGVSRLLSGKEMKLLLRDVVEQQWLVKPQDLKQQNKISELYERMGEQIRQMEGAMKAAGITRNSFLQTASDIRGNIEFMNQMNQMYTYLQMPLKLTGQNANGELYVYTNKKKFTDPAAELTAFLHLDLEHLGSTDVSVRMRNRKVHTNFYLPDDKAYGLVEKHLPILERRLKDKGYSCSVTITHEKKDVNFVDNIFRKEQPQAGSLHRYSFDVRA